VTLAPIISVKNISKSFGAIVALSDVSLELYEREVLALLGDNGAGKSTLIKILSGLHQPDVGELYLAGAQVSFRHTHDARAAGIETVYQDLALFDNLTPQANFFIGRETKWPRWAGPFGLLVEKPMERAWRARAQELRVGIPGGRQTVGLMSGGQRQAIAVARAVAFATRVVILDEPTAALGVRESEEVLRLIAGLAEQGISVILISHNMEHVTRVADRAVVLRQGRNVGEARAEASEHAKIVSLIIGAEYGADESAHPSSQSI
jgi:ABC-type sugar transport system ATPase subunit